MIPDYDHIQRESRAYNPRLEKLYLREEPARPSFVQRIVTAVRKSIQKRSARSALAARTTARRAL